VADIRSALAMVGGGSCAGDGGAGGRYSGLVREAREKTAVVEHYPRR